VEKYCKIIKSGLRGVQAFTLLPVIGRDLRPHEMVPFITFITCVGYEGGIPMKELQSVAQKTGVSSPASPALLWMWNHAFQLCYKPQTRESAHTTESTSQSGPLHNLPFIRWKPAVGTALGRRYWRRKIGCVASRCRLMCGEARNYHRFQRLPWTGLTTGVDVPQKREEPPEGAVHVRIARQNEASTTSSLEKQQVGPPAVP
jgi:hypothetical protein